jgi:hypothetical protein
MTQKKNFVDGLKIFGLLALLLFGGIGLGLLLVKIFSPSSALADFFGFMTFPLAFGISMTLWYYAASAVLVTKLVKILLKNRGKENFKETVSSEMGQYRNKPLPAIFLFVPICTIISFIGGVLVGFNPTANFWIVVIVFTIAGFIYGLILKKLAHSGKLPLPEYVE